MNDIIVIPEQDYTIVFAGEDCTITIPAESRVIEMEEHMPVASKRHTEGDIRRWTLRYGQWLDNPAKITLCEIASSSPSLAATLDEILGTDVTFMLNGGVAGETATVAVAMTDDQGNTKNDTIKFTVVAP